MIAPSELHVQELSDIRSNLMYLKSCYIDFTFIILTLVVTCHSHCLLIYLNN